MSHTVRQADPPGDRPWGNARVPRRSLALGIAAGYAALGSLWILVSDYELRRWVTDDETADLLETVKGWLFVAVTALVLGFLLDRYFRVIRLATGKVEEAERRWQLALEGAGDGAWDWNPQTNEVFYSRRWKTMHGYAEEEIGTRLAEWQDRVHPEDLQRVLQAIQRHLEGSTPFYVCEHRVRCKDGNYKWILDSGRVVDRTEEGRPLRVVGTHKDITERRQAEIELERIALQLERKNRELETLVYVTSHDLRTPLLNIQGFSRRLEAQALDIRGRLAALPLSADDRKALEEVTGVQMPRAVGFVLAGVGQMDRLIGGLLRLSRLGRAGLKHEPLDLNGLLQELLPALAYSVEAAGASIEVQSLPACHGDATQINQIFTNLLSNALKYRDPARPLRILVSGRLVEGRSVYCVEDNGVGIPVADQEKIWEPFQRLHTDDGIPGDGLGLSLVRRIAERHHGEAWVGSTPGEGSRFYVALPSDNP